MPVILSHRKQNRKNPLPPTKIKIKKPGIYAKEVGVRNPSEETYHSRAINSEPVQPANTGIL
jgi:hypothetical protein